MLHSDVVGYQHFGELCWLRIQDSG